MRTKLTKWGNSYAVRLPKQLILELDLRAESDLQLERKGDTITIKRSSKEEQLRELLEGMEAPEVIDWGQARGKETW
jgi:antitoxin MazE